MLKIYLELNFHVLHAATGNWYVDATDIRLDNLGPIALSSPYKLTTSSRKPVGDISSAQIVSSMYKLMTSAKDTEGLSIGFDRDRNRRQPELNHNNNWNKSYLIGFMLRDVFGFAECQEKATCGLEDLLTLKRDNDSSVLNRTNSTNIANFKIRSIEWYVLHYTPSMEQKKVISNQILSKIPTELQNLEWSVFMKEINTRNFWTSESWNQEGKNFSIWIIVDFQQGDRQDSQNINKNSFYRPPVTSAQKFIGT